jgi:UDP-N-acetylmuramyl pentapeptide phosphotransferase/UDP-N-acetylglucosamine-1-phosphate transferase
VGDILDRRREIRTGSTARRARARVIVVIGLIVGLLAVRLLVIGGRDVLEAPALQRRNYRNRLLPTAAGLLVVIAVLLIEAGRSTLGAFGLGDEPGRNIARSLVLFACLGFGLLGLIDDLLGTQGDQGFRGHLRALFAGRVTTGALKIFGGAAVALVLASNVSYVTGRRLLADAVLIALAANLANLLDRAPGRAIKVGLLAWIPLAFVAGTDGVGVAIAPVIGAFCGLLGDDLHEHLMLGDTGANVLGAVLGLAVVLDVGRGSRNVVLIALILLTVAAEAVSFSAVIKRVPILRRFDELGQLPAP